MGVWSHIILEGFCMFSHLSKKKHTYYTIKDLKTWKCGKKHVESNKHYIPPKERPRWCINQNKKRIPQFRCLCYGDDKRCPFFAMTNANRSDYKYLSKKYSEQI